MAKKRAGSQIANFDSPSLKVDNHLIYLCVGGIPHTAGNFSMKATTLL